MQDQDSRRAIVQRMIDAGESEDNIALVIRSFQPVTSSPRKPESTLDRMKAGATMGLQATGQLEGVRALRNLVRRENWPMLAGGAAGLATGGLGAVPAMAIAAGAGALGRGAAMMDEASDTGSEPASVGQMAQDIGIEGATQGALEGAGRGIVAGGQKVANVLMRRALGPSKAAGLKYGDLPQQALDRRAMVSERGAEKMQGIREATQARKVNAINTARPVSILTSPIKRGAADQTIDTAVGQQLAGLRSTMDPSPAVARFGGGRPGISLPESELAKRQLDTVTDAARQATRMGKRPTLGDAERIALSREILESQDQIVPGMRAMNRDISQAMGLEQAIRQRVAMPGAGLADEAAIMGSLVDPRMALSRVIREPQALSALSILINELSKGGKVAPAVARGLMLTSRDQ